MSLARRRWRDFEALAYELTKDCFDTTPTRILRTRESKDGGFDAVAVHQLGRLGDATILFETLMEAKLRSKKDALGLRAFAATMVVAFNGSANCVVVVTNREFSPQALEAARDFQWKSRLQVILANRATVAAWVRKRLDYLATKYPKDLLDDLLSHDDEIEGSQEVEIPATGPLGAEPAARIRFGSLDGDAASAGRIRFVKPALQGESFAVVGHERQAIANALRIALSDSAGFAVVSGTSGTGKSHIVRSATRTVTTRRCLGFVDLAHVGTSRQLFLLLVSHLMGLDIGEIIGGLGESSAKTMFGRARGVEVPEGVLSAIVQLVRAQRESDAERDLDQLLLIEYLALVAKSQVPDQRLLVVHNADKTTGEVLEFLHSATNTLTDNGVSLVLELTTSAETDTSDRREWKGHVRLFEQSATLGCFSVPPMDDNTSVEYLLSQLPGLGVERARFIASRVGQRALFLQHAALWLKRRAIVEERAPGEHLIEQPEVFFEGLRPEACEALLDRHIDLWRREIDLPYADMISTAALLSGRLSLDVLLVLLGDLSKAEVMCDALISTGLFEAEPSHTGVRVSHSLLLERMLAIEEGRVPGCAARAFARRRLAQQLIERSEECWPIPLERLWHRGALLLVTQQWAEAWEVCRGAGEQLEAQRQLARAADSYERALQSATTLAGLGDRRSDVWRIVGLTDLLRVEDGRYRLGLPENITRLQILEQALAGGVLANGQTVPLELTLQGLYLQWRAEFTAERFNIALRIAEEMCDSARSSGSCDAQWASRSFAALGITLKAVERLPDSIKVFEEGVALFQDSAILRRARLSNLAALALREHPNVALGYYREIISDSPDEIGLLEQLHLEGDLAMAELLSGLPAAASIQAGRAIRLADANGVPAQAARARNLLGCISWAEGAFSSAIALFDRAILDSERSFMDRFIWRFRTNLAAAAAEDGKILRALANARSAEERVIGPRLAIWLDHGASPTHQRSRWYVALLSIGLTYHRCDAGGDMDRLRSILTPLPAFGQHLSELIGGAFPTAVFEGTTHRNGSRIMITG